ncbi:protein tramtrack, beta isoform-like isoform X7 [Neocloeon triangulifer]|uniref:protein tramtrack, beta isoform-like isoform X7 n=1 Tax=Neocloeon triangulifer TaxID=2078957 RepID=UPI00286ECF35|nr:protein tramtrack, beta isoform-like isoform X7 [Neocloeon triangulifer]
MASQQYSLRWNNYVRHMTSAFESLRSDRDLIDVTLSCEGKKIPAHKMLLSACSSYFKDLFKENPCQHPVIIFRNVTFDDLMALVDFMYNGEVNVEQEQLASFLHTAELLQVQGLTNSNKDSETKTKKTAKQQDERVPAPEVQFDEDGHPSPYQSDERTSTPTRTTGPPAAKKRKWQSPSRTASPAEVQAIPQGASSGGEGEEGEPHQMEDVPLKTEAAEYEDDDDEQASGADDIVEEQESIIAKIQKSDQLILTTSTSRSRASNSDHSLFGGNVMDMLSTSESGDMGNFVMAGPSNESMGQEGIQGMPELVMIDDDEDDAELFDEEEMEAHGEFVLLGGVQQPQCVARNGRFECSVCSKSFSNKPNCVRHFALHLGDSDGPLECAVCRKRFRTHQTRQKHMSVHLGLATCPVCSATLSNAQCLRRHLKSVHQLT